MSFPDFEDDTAEFDTREMLALEETQSLDDTKPMTPIDTRWSIRAAMYDDMLIVPRSPEDDELVRRAERHWERQKNSVWARILRRLGR